MKISRNSWHYRLVQIYGPSYIPGNLCPYVRNLFYTLLAISLGVVLCAGLVIAVLELIGTLICRAIFGVWFSFLFSNLEVFGVTCLAMGGVALLIGCTEGPSWISKKIRHADGDMMTLVRGYYHAKHDKICPELEFED